MWETFKGAGCTPCLVTTMNNPRRSVRLSGYDYAQDGVYFITICAYERQPLFGEIHNDICCLNQKGSITEEEWLKTATIRQEIELDAFVIMPNHFHAIVVIDQAHSRAPLPQSPSLKRPPYSLGSLIAGFKSSVTTRINTSGNTPGFRVWQRNYYEHIIRNQRSLDTIRQYILSNPAQWASDRENPDNLYL